ncbi:MAG: hypothetical protein LBU22_08620 [Dysgonamonadaceae bacterium]|jgi:hypothetical protein|nr:hypothetical protein [Dysgonamonadaceae bacterium]
MKTNFTKTGLLLTIAGTLLFACKQNNDGLNEKALESYYGLPEDSLQREALRFLLRNMEDQTAEIPVFSNFMTDSIVDLRFDTIANEAHLRSIIKGQKLIVSKKTIPDRQIIDSHVLVGNINRAFQTWNAYPWAKRVPKDVFLNYLLPYKVYGEKPADWRSFFQSKYKPIMDSIISRQIEMNVESSNELYYKILVDEVGQWFKYDTHALHLTRFPGFEELMLSKRGECNRWSYLNVFILRSLGIPATVDIIPVWGRKNASHTTEVFWDDETGKFRTPSGRELFFPAKVFRYSFKKQNMWSDSIQPFVDANHFLLEYLQHNHWSDVTHEHTKTVNIQYTLNEQTDSNIAYICVFNYGEWVPVYWGKINGKTKVSFVNMGAEILYRIAIPYHNSYKIISKVFKADDAGNLIYYLPDSKHKVDMALHKVNTGSDSWVKRGEKYELSMLDANGDWKQVETRICDGDSSLIFKNVPGKTLYKLLAVNEKKRLERIFTYENDAQIFY